MEVAADVKVLRWMVPTTKTWWSQSVHDTTNFQMPCIVVVLTHVSLCNSAGLGPIDAPQAAGVKISHLCPMVEISK